MHGSGDPDDDAGPVPSHPDVRRGTRCSLSGSCPRIAQRSWAFRRRSPADPAVRPALHLGTHAVSPARLQRVETLSQPRRLRCAAFRSARVPLAATRKRLEPNVATGGGGTPGGGPPPRATRPQPRHRGCNGERRGTAGGAGGRTLGAEGAGPATRVYTAPARGPRAGHWKG